MRAQPALHSPRSASTAALRLTWQENDYFSLPDGRMFVVEEVYSDGVVCGSYTTKDNPGILDGYRELTADDMEAEGMRFHHGPSAASSPAHVPNSLFC